MRHIPAAGLAAVLAWSGSSYAQQPTAATSVRQTVAAFAATWNRHDMAAFGQLFAPNADFVNVTGSWWKGVARRFNNTTRTPTARFPKPTLLLFVVARSGDEWQIAAAQNTEIHRTVH